MFEEELGGVNRNQVNEVSTPANFASAESLEPITPVLKMDAPQPEIKTTDGYKSPDFNSYTDEDKNRVATQYGESWKKMSWWDKQRALAHDSWNGALERGEIDEETLVDGIFKDPEIERINKSETEFKSILRDAVKRDVSTMSDDEAQGYYMALVEADPHFRYKDDADGKMLFGEEAQYGRGNLSRLLGVYKGTNPQGLFSREAQKWFNLSDEQKKQVADRERTIKDSVFGMFDENGNIVDSHEQKLMREEKAVQFATLMGSLSPLGQEIVTQSIDKGELDARTLRLLDEDERDAALAAFRVNKATLDANWWLTQGAAKAWETGSSMVKGTWRQLANAYWFAYWAAGERTPSDLRQLDAYEEEQKQQLKIEDAMRWKYKDNLTLVGDIAAGLMGSAPYMAAMSNPYGGTLAVLGMANDARERMVLSGVDQETALAISFPVGVVEGWIEKLQWNKVFGKGLSEYALRRNSLLAIAKQLSKGKAKYIGGKLLKGGKEAAITTLTEDCEEVLQQLTEDFGVALGKGEFNVREMVEDMWDTAVESFPTTLGFGLMRASGIGPSIHRRYSKNAVIASEFSEYMQGKNAALNVISKVNSENAADGIAQNASKPASTPSAEKTDNVPSDTAEAQEGGKSAVYERLLDEMRVKWNGSKSVKARFESLTNAGLNTDQAAIVDEFFRLENEFVSENPVYNFYDPKDGQIYRNFDIMSLPSIMKGVKRVEQNADGTYNLDLQLDADTIVPVKVERVSRASLRTKAGAQFEKQVAANYEDAHGKGSWAKLDDDEKLVKIYSAVPGGFTKVTVGDTTLPYKAIVSLAAPDAAENDPGAKNYEIGHEIFHAATLVAKRMGIMTDEDLAKMREVFGEAKIEGYAFDEEKAADEYGKWLVSKANDSTGLFAKIRDFFRKIYNALFNKNGNEQPEMDAEEIFKRIERGELSSITGTKIADRGSESGRFSLVTSEQDREYMDAVKRGDMETAQRMVREAAARAMPDTKVVDKDGLPMVVWHGSPSQELITIEEGMFSSNKEVAAFFDGSLYDGVGKSYGCFINLRNPFVIDTDGALWDEIPIKNEVAKSLGLEMSPYASGTARKKSKLTDSVYVTTDEIGKAIRASGGYDGVIMKNVVETDEENKFSPLDVVAFSPSQIKSADPVTYDDNGNIIPLSERFNEDNPDIRFAVKLPITATAEELIAASAGVQATRVDDSETLANGKTYTESFGEEKPYETRPTAHSIPLNTWVPIESTHCANPKRNNKIVGFAWFDSIKEYTKANFHSPENQAEHLVPEGTKFDALDKKYGYHIARYIPIEPREPSVPADGFRKARFSVSSMTDAAAQDNTAIDLSNARYSAANEEDLKRIILDEFRGSREAKNLEWTDEQIVGAVEGVFNVIAGVHSAAKGDKNYAEAAKALPTVRVDWRDGEEKPIVSWVRGNIEYKYDMSADTMCINNEGLEQMLSDPTMADLMIAFSEDTEYGSDDYLRLYETLRDMGYVVPCKGCFDAAMRLKMLPSVAQTFVAEVNAVVDERNKNPKKFDAAIRAKAKEGIASIEGLPLTAGTKSEAIRIGVAGDKLTKHINWTQLMSAKGQTKALTDWGGIFRAWQKTGTSRPKDKLLPEAYGGVIISGTTTIIAPYGEKTPSFRDIEVNQGTGLRRNSHSEFRPTLIVDEIQFLRDCWLKGLCVFKYMKELDDVRLFGKMGIKYNMSAFPAFVSDCTAAGLDKNGNYVWAEESVGGREFEYKGKDGKIHYDGAKGFKEAQKYINKDVSLSSVIFSVPHLIKAMTDVPTKSDKRGLFGSLIGFHNSGADAKALEVQGLGKERAYLPNNKFAEEAMTDYNLGVTNFEQVQNDRFGEGWKILLGKKAGTNVNPGHKVEFANGTIYRNDKLGVTIYASEQTYRKNGGKKRFGFSGPIYILDREGGKVAHSFDVSYNDKVRELGGDYAYQDAADFYIKEFASIGILPRFDFKVPKAVFIKMCKDANVDPRHPKLGWKGGDWSPINAESYYSLFCDFGMTDPKTGKWSPHRPVLDGQRNSDAFKNALPKNYLEIIKEGLKNFTRRKDRETKMDREALLEYSRRSIMAGKTKADKVKKILRKHGFSAKEISSLDNSSRFSISQSGKDPADIIAGIVAMKARRGEKMTINQVQKLLASVGADTSLGADILLRGQRSGEKIGDIIKGKAVDDNAFIEMATDEAKRNRLLQFAENVGKEGYRLGAKDEEAINSLLEAKNAAALLVLENAVGFKASEMEQKYGFDLVNSVQNAKLTAAHPIAKEGKKDNPGEVNGPGVGLGEMMDAEEAAKAAKQTTAVDAPESAQMESLKNKAAKRADKIDAKYGLSAGMSPAQLQAAKDAEVQAEWDAAHPGEGATTEEKPINKVTVKRDKLDFNRASDFLAFVEEVVAKEIGNDRFENPADIRNLANTAKFFLKKVATKLMYSRDRELIMKDLDGFANIATLEGLESAVMNTYTRIQDRLIPETQEQLIHKLEWEGKQLAEQGVFFSRGGDERNRKVQAKVEEWWRMVKAYLRFSPEAVQEELERLNGIIERRTQKAEADKAVTPDSPDFLGQDLEYRRAIDLKNALTQYGGLINKTPGEIADKAEEIINQLKGSRFELENKREDQYIRTRTMSEVLKKAIVNPKAQKDRKAPNPNWLVRMFDSMMGVLEVRLRDLIRFSSGETRRKAETAIQDIEDSFALASQSYNCYLVDNQQQIDEILTKLYGSAEKGIIRLTEDLPDEDRKLIAKQAKTNTINRSWLLQRYVELQQTDDYAQNISVNKRNGKWREDFDKVFAKYISTDDMTLLVWMRNWYRNNLGDLNNKVLIPVSGIAQYSPSENYFPVKMKLPTREGPVAMAKAWSPLPSWLTPRVYNNYDFDESTDLISMWYKRMRESGASIAYAQLGLNINDVLLNPGFKDAVEANHGEVALRRLSEHLTDIISGGASQMAESDDSIAFADRLRAWQTNLTLSCNYVSALKQMTSCPVYALRHDIDFGMVWRFMTDIDIGSVKELMASDGWKSRYGQGFSEAMQNAMRLNSAVAKGKMASAQNFLHHLYNSGFAVMEFGDSVPCVWVGQGLYRYFLAKIRDEEGGNAVMSEMDIKDRAMARTWAVIEMTQQSKRTENLTAAQRGGSMGRFLYQFVSSPVQQLAYEVQAIREALAARGTEHAKEANAHLGRVLVVNHILMPNFLELASLVAGLPLGKIPEKEDTFWNFLMNTLMGQYGCIFLAGMVGENTLNALITGKFDYRAQGLPVMGIVDLFQKVGIGMHDLLMWNNDEFADDAIKILKSIGAPTRHAATAIENWGTRKGEKKRRKAAKTWTK